MPKALRDSESSRWPRSSRWNFDSAEAAASDRKLLATRVDEKAVNGKFDHGMTISLVPALSATSEQQDREAGEDPWSVVCG